MGEITIGKLHKLWLENLYNLPIDRKNARGSRSRAFERVDPNRKNTKKRLGSVKGLSMNTIQSTAERGAELFATGSAPLSYPQGLWFTFIYRNLVATLRSRYLYRGGLMSLSWASLRFGLPSLTLCLYYSI